MIEVTEERSPRFRFSWLAAVAIIAAVFSIAALRSTSRWWFEDDPAQFATVSAIRNPASIFVDPHIVRGFGTGASLVPMQLLSYWVDVRLFGASPGPAYVHSLVSMAATVLLLFALLARLTRDLPAAATVSILWILLPSTIAVHSFLSTRHYMEGLGWSLASALLFELASRPPQTPGFRPLLAATFICAAAAMLSKELYVFILPLWLAATAFARRRHALAAGFIVLALAYAGYRLATLGTGGAYPGPRFSPRDYGRYLVALPYTLTANRGGYVLYGALAAAIMVLWIRRGRALAREVAVFAVLLAAVLVPSYPTAPALLATYRIPGTWYRSVFLINTIVLAGGAVLLILHAGRVAKALAAAVALAVVLPGSVETSRLWDIRMKRAEEEGKFYLANPDKLVYSEEDAAWFLWGLDRLYGVRRPHFINKMEVESSSAKRMLREFPTIWRNRDGRWNPDSRLFAEIARRNEEAKPPP